ncbi:MAG: hypothetical protein WC437_04690 [Patescibacteria group bacterium]|jgi:hypothetical protein
MENKRPTLTDPKEYALVRSIHFPMDNLNNDKVDEIERLERMESKQRNQNNNSR